jgi:hypothetical protein
MACNSLATRLCLHGIVLLVVLVMATTARAQVAIPDDVAAVADEAGVDALHLLGAVNTTNLDPREYLYGVGELARPARIVAISPAGWPIGGALGQRIYCIEGIESTHGRSMFNPTPWAGQHAQGWLGWLPSTAASVGVRIGDRVSEWQGAALMLAHGRGREFYGVQAGIC